jgi:hypothetical protein
MKSDGEEQGGDGAGFVDTETVNGEGATSMLSSSLAFDFLEQRINILDRRKLSREN